MKMKKSFRGYIFFVAISLMGTFFILKTRISEFRSSDLLTGTELPNTDLIQQGEQGKPALTKSDQQDSHSNDFLAIPKIAGNESHWLQTLRKLKFQVIKRRD